MSLETWQTPSPRQEEYTVHIRKPNMCAYFMDMHETDCSFAQQHRSRNYFVWRQSANGRDPLHWVFETQSLTSWNHWLGEIRSNVQKHSKPKKQVGHNGFSGESNCPTCERLFMFFKTRKPWSERLESQHGTRFQISQSWSWLAVGLHQSWESHSSQIRDTTQQIACVVTAGSFSQKALDAIDTFFKRHIKRTPAALLWHLYLLATACRSDQVLRKSKSLRGLWRLTRKNGSQAMKQVGRDEEKPGGAAWRIPVRPHSSPNTARKTDCDKDPTSDSAWWNPMQPISSQQERNRGQSSSRPSWSAHVKTLIPVPTARWGQGWDWHQHLKFRWDPSIELQTLSNEEKDMDDHIIQTMCLNLET